MNRTFHNHISIQGLAAVILLAAAGLWCFMLRSGVAPLFGFACLLLGAAAVDRLVGTTYTFTADNRLLIVRGRLGKPLSIPVGDIVSVRPVRGSLFTASHIVIEYGCGRITYAQPARSREFVEEIRRRQKHDN